MIEYTDNTHAYDVTESAKLLGVVPATVRYYLREGKISGQMYKTKIYIHEEEIERFLRERSTK